jgi:DNA polymerase-4
MDAFFARVEKNDNPEYKDQPVVVGGLGKRGVVSTACYQAREYGIHSAMPMSEARERCPEAVFLSPRSERYRELSYEIRDIFHSVTPSVQTISLDEAYLDLTGVLHKHESEASLARGLREKIYTTTGLTASVGIGPNTMIAKLASDQAKPEGSRIVSPQSVKSFLAPLDINAVPGFGPNTCQRMHEHGIETIGDLQALSSDKLQQLFGQRGIIYNRKANGMGSTSLTVDEDAKSISNEETYENNLTDDSDLLDRLHTLTDKVAKRLRRKNFEAKTVFIKERRGDFTTLTRQRTLVQPIFDTESIWEQVKHLFNNNFSVDNRGIRLQGVGLTNLREKGVQQSLFNDDNQENRNELNDVIDDINQEMGSDSVVRARNLSND